MTSNSILREVVPISKTCTTNYGASCNYRNNIDEKTLNKIKDEIKKDLENRINNRENEEKIYEKIIDRIKDQLGKKEIDKDKEEIKKDDIFSHLGISVNLETGEILDNTNGKSTGKVYLDCVKILRN